MARRAATDPARPPKPGRAQRHDAPGAARRDDRLPGRGRLREHDDEPRVRARRALARRAPASLPDAPGAARGGDGAPRRAPRRSSCSRPPRSSRAGPRAPRARARPAVGGLRQPALPGGARPVDARAHRPRAARAPGAGRARPRPPDAARCRRTLFGELAERPGLRPADRDGRTRRCAGSRCSTRCTPAADATAASGRTAAQRLVAMFEDIPEEER